MQLLVFDHIACPRPLELQEVPDCRLSSFKKILVLRSLGAAQTFCEWIILDVQTHGVSLCDLEMLVVATCELIP